MELKIRKNGEVYIIDVNGEMDLYNSYKLKELVMKMLEKNVKSFIINLVTSKIAGICNISPSIMSDNIIIH